MQSAQQALSDEDASRTVKNVEISPKQFKDFKSFLNIIKSEFNDFSMVDGAFRSYCNDSRRKCIVETGFPFFTDISFTVCNIKTFLKSISTHGEKFPVNVTVTDSKITFEDLYGGNVEFLTANPEHSDNPFITNDDLDSKFLTNVDTEKLMVKDAVPQVVVSKLKLMRGKLSSKHICISHDENDLGSGFLSISNRSEESIKTQRILSSAMIDIAEYGVRLNRPFLIPMKKNHFFNLDILPTLFRKDDLYIKCYLTNDKKIFAIINSKVNDLFVNIYLESKLCGETEVPLKGSVKKTKNKSKEKPKKVTKTASSSTINLSNRLFGDLCVNYRLEKSFNGYDPSVLKSGVQKYLRRAEMEKGLWCLVEMDLFSLLEWDGDALEAYLRQYPEKTSEYTKRQSRKQRSNMINRIIAMTSEEVGISAWWMPLKIFELYQKWIENRDNPSSRQYLVKMYLHLTTQEMIRLISDIVAIYQLPLNHQKEAKKSNLLPMQTYKNIQEQYPTIYADQTNVGHVTWTVSKDNFPSTLQPCIDGIIYNLEIGSDHVFYWIRQLSDIAKQDGAPKFKYFNILWKILHLFIDRNREYECVRGQICALQEFYKRMTHEEKPIYLYHAVLLIVRRKEIDWTLRPSKVDIMTNDIDKLYSDHLSGGKVKIDDYVLDMHTRRGKKDGNCMENFALEGAKVKYENERFLNKEYREIFSLMGKELDRHNSRRKKYDESKRS